MSADHQFLLVDLPLGPGSSDVDSSNPSLVISVMSFCCSSLHTCSSSCLLSSGFPGPLKSCNILVVCLFDQLWLSNDFDEFIS